MIAWHALTARLSRLARGSLPGRLLTVTLPLPHWPAASAPEGSDWCFWQRPDCGLRLLGLGRALVAASSGMGRFSALHAAQRGLADGWRQDSQTGAPALAFTGFAFAPRGGEPLPNASLWVPELLLRESGKAISASFSCAANQVGDAPARWRALWQSLRTDPGNEFATPYLVLRNPLEEESFLSRGRAALRAIAAGQADKLVLTRTLHLRAEAPAAAGAVLAALAARHPACATFGVARQGKIFVAASPETLLSLAGPVVAVDALAGTSWQEAALSLGADKNRREHDFVARDVVAGLATLCHDITVPSSREVMHINALSHLRRRVSARRPPEVSAFDLIARLHPTPAVGGTPTAAALDWLARHGDRRGSWYTGGMGWIDAEGDCDIAVPLRCGLLDGCDATLYAGAGFVAGSDPVQEFAETEAKFSAMRAALAVVPEQAIEERSAA